MRSLKAMALEATPVLLQEQLAGARAESAELRRVLTWLTDAVETWGQWTMSGDLAAAWWAAQRALTRGSR